MWHCKLHNRPSQVISSLISGSMATTKDDDEVVVAVATKASAPWVLRYETFYQRVEDASRWVNGVDSLGVWPLQFLQKADKYGDMQLSYAVPSWSHQHLPLAGVHELGRIEMWIEPVWPHHALAKYTW